MKEAAGEVPGRASPVGVVAIRKEVKRKERHLCCSKLGCPLFVNRL